MKTKIFSHFWFLGIPDETIIFFQNDAEVGILRKIFFAFLVLNDK